MKLMALDLEMNQPSGKIIQIGYVAADYETREVIDQGCINVNCHETLNPFIIELTGITQEQTNLGIELSEAYKKLKMAHEGCFRNPITWGGGDSAELRKQLGLDDAQFLFGRRWIDAKTLYCSWAIANGYKPMGGLGASMKKLKLSFFGAKHNALDDAYNTMLIYFKLLDYFKQQKTSNQP